MQGLGHDGARRPMQWSGDPGAGFTDGTPWAEPGPGWEHDHVAAQTGEPDSLLSHYRTLIRARNEHAALRVGDLWVVDGGHPSVYSVLRVSADEAVLVVINLSGGTVTDYRLTLPDGSLDPGWRQPASVLGDLTPEPVLISSRGGFSNYVPLPSLDPYATHLLQLVPATTP
jgi:oligo-1,6-glucosidase